MKFILPRSKQYKPLAENKIVFRIFNLIFQYFVWKKKKVDNSFVVHYKKIRKFLRKISCVSQVFCLFSPIIKKNSKNFLLLILLQYKLDSLSYQENIEVKHLRIVTAPKSDKRKKNITVSNRSVQNLKKKYLKSLDY